MKKKIFLAIIGLIVLVGAIGGIKVLQIGKMVSRGKNFAPPPETVTTARAKAESWESAVPSVGSLEAVQGVMVTAEVTGKIVRIAFEPGKKVESGDLLLQQDTSLEEAQLRAAEASATLARADFERIKELLSKNAISRSQYDNADAKYKSAIAEADGIRAVIEKKNIRAPFAGRLGIRLVNLGQLLKEGGAIVSLQAPRSDLCQFSASPEGNRPDWPGHDDPGRDRRLAGQDPRRQDHGHQPGGRCGHAQYPDPGHHGQPRGAASPRHVRQCGRGDA